MKKMRRLIPAIAMLLVSAVMLSTASFAWFTMNEKVEATGMTVQAKSDGTMVIDTKPLTALSTGWEAQFAPLGNKKISPVSYGTYHVASEVATGGDENGIQIDTTPSTGWFDAYKPELVDSMTGESKYFKTASLNGNYVDYVVYIGLASESAVKNIKATLTTTSDLHIAGAYAIAFYVDTDITSTETYGTDATPALVLHCNDETTTTKYTGNLFTSAVTIPSTVGVTATQDNPGVGIKVTMRVFIDGNLKDGGEYVPMKATYKPAEGKFDPAVSYFVKDGNNYVNAEINDNDYTNADGTYKDVDVDWYVFDKYEKDTENARDTYFVSNANAPMAPSALDVSFELVDDPQN